MSAVPVPTGPGPFVLVRGFLAGIVIGTTLCAFVVGIIIENVPLVLAGLGLPLAYGILLYLAGAPRRAREAAVVPVTALAKIESLRAGGTETGDLPVDFVLTVAPDGAPMLASWLRHAEPSAKRRAAVTLDGERPDAEVDRLALQNVLQQLDHLRHYPLIAEAEARGELHLTGMYFDVGAAQVYLSDEGNPSFLPVGAITTSGS